MPGNSAGEAAAYSPFLDLLPLEVRNMIYRMAYVEESGRIFPIISKTDWVTAERDRRARSRLRYTPDPTKSRRGTSERFPVSPMQGMHVSRQFEREAVREWFQHCTIDCEDLAKWARLCKLDARIEANVVSLRCSWDSGGSDYHSRLRSNRPNIDFSQLQVCKQLRHLQLRVNDSVFDNIPDRFVFHDDYEPKDFQRLERVVAFTKIPALQSVLLIPQANGGLADTPEEDEKWKDNLQGLEDFINQQIKNKRVSSCVQTKPGTITYEWFVASCR